MKNFKQSVQKTRNTLRRKLNDISGKIKLRAYLVVILALIAIILMRMFINLNPSYISSITEKYSDFLSSKDVFLSLTDEIVYIFELKVSNVITSLNIIGTLLTKTFLNNNYPDSLSFDQKSCNYDNVSKCAIFSKETHYLLNSQGIYFTTSVFINISEITADNWSVIAESQVIDQILPQMFLDYNPSFDLYNQVYIVFTQAQILKIYPAKNKTSDEFIWLFNDKSMKNWFFQAKSITNKNQSYFVFDATNHLAIIAKPFFNSSNNQCLGVIAAEINTNLFTGNLPTSSICFNWNSFLFDINGVCLNTDIYPNPTPITQILENPYCSDLKDYLTKYKDFSNINSFTCTETKDSEDLITIKPILPNMFINQPSISYIAYCDKNDLVRLSSENIIRVTSYVYICAFLLLYGLLLYAISRFINLYVKDIINPIKQITYKIHRSLKNLFRKKNLIKIQPDDIVIREPTEIREVAENFSCSYKKMMTKNIFLNELELGEKMILGKQKVIHNKVTEKMLENIKEAIEKIPYELDTN